MDNSPGAALTPVLPRCARCLTPAEERHRERARRGYADRVRRYLANREAGAVVLNNTARGTMYEVLLALRHDLLRWEDIPPDREDLRFPDHGVDLVSHDCTHAGQAKCYGPRSAVSRARST